MLLCEGTGGMRKLIVAEKQVKDVTNVMTSV